jgi:hypothetical protein
MRAFVFKKKIGMVEVGGKWLLGPGDVIFEHRTKLTNNALLFLAVMCSGSD